MDDDKMPLTAHLGELRKRLVVSLSVLLVTFTVCFAFSEDIFRLIMFPLKYDLDFSVTQMYVQFVQKDKLQSTKLVFLGPAEAFWMNMKVALVSGFFFALPVIFFQVWKFISPGLLPKERKYVLPFVLVTTGLFIGGAAFCFIIVLPFALGFLLTYKVGDFLLPMLSVGQYVDFCLKFILAFGIIFETPIVIVFLTKLGIVTPQTLARSRKYAVLLAFVISAFLTPTPDAFNQCLMAVPIIILYELGIWISPLFTPSRKRSSPEAAGESAERVGS